MRRVEPGHQPRHDQQRPDEHAEHAADADVDDELDRAVDQHAAQREGEQLKAGQDQQQAAPEGAAAPPGPPASRRGRRCRGAGTASAGPEPASGTVPASSAVMAPAAPAEAEAEVGQGERARRGVPGLLHELVDGDRVACSPKVPAGRPSCPASWPMLMLLKTAELAVWPSASTTRLLALTGSPPAAGGEVDGQPENRDALAQVRHRRVLHGGDDDRGLAAACCSAARRRTARIRCHSAGQR